MTWDLMALGWHGAYWNNFGKTIQTCDTGFVAFGYFTDINASMCFLPQELWWRRPIGGHSSNSHCNIDRVNIVSPSIRWFSMKPDVVSPEIILIDQLTWYSKQLLKLQLIRSRYLRILAEISQASGSSMLAPHSSRQSSEGWIQGRSEESDWRYFVVL